MTNFREWLLNEGNKKNQRELKALLLANGFIFLRGSKEDIYMKDGVKVTVSRQSNIPPRQMLRTIIKDWENNKRNIEYLNRTRGKVETVLSYLAQGDL